MKYRKKPVEIEAIQFDGSNAMAIIEWVNDNTPGFDKSDSNTWGISFYYGEFKIRTLEGEMTGRKKDWIIKGVNGEFYPCKPDIFEKTYDVVDDHQ